MRGRWLAAGLGILGAVAAIAAVRRDADVTEASWIAQRYDRLAGVYDILAAPYDWLDGRRLIRRAIAELRLAPGDTAVALGTGTGWSLPLLAEPVGPSGHVVGVGLSEGMLRRARARVERAGVADRVDLMVADMRTVEESVPAVSPPAAGLRPWATRSSAKRATVAPSWPLAALGGKHHTAGCPGP